MSLGCYWFVSMSRNAYIPVESSPQNYLSESWMINNKHVYFRLNEKINFKGFGGFCLSSIFAVYASKILKLKDCFEEAHQIDHFENFGTRQLFWNCFCTDKRVSAVQKWTGKRFRCHDCLCDMHWKVLREHFHLVPKSGPTGLEVQPHRRPG